MSFCSPCSLPPRQYIMFVLVKQSHPWDSNNQGGESTDTTAPVLGFFRFDSKPLVKLLRQPNLWWAQWRWEPEEHTLLTPLTWHLVCYHLLCVSFRPAFCLHLLSLHGNIAPNTLAVFLFQLILDLFLTILHTATKHPFEPIRRYPAFSFPSLPSRNSEVALFNWNAKKNSGLR